MSAFIRALVVALTFPLVACGHTVEDSGAGGSDGFGAAGGAGPDVIIGTGGVANTGQQAWRQFESCPIAPAKKFEFDRESLKSFVAYMAHRDPGKYTLRDYQLDTRTLIIVLREGTDIVPVVAMQESEPFGGASSDPVTDKSYDDPLSCELAEPAFFEACLSDPIGKCFTRSDSGFYEPKFLRNCKSALVACH